MRKQAPPLLDRNAAWSLVFRAKLVRFVARQSWIPRGRNRIINAIWNSASARSLPFVVDFYGFRYPGNMQRRLDWLVFTFGCASPAEFALLSALSAELRRRKATIAFFDVGANVGHHTLFMAGRADEVIAFEPFPPMIEKIREKVEVNRLSNVRIVPFGLGDADASLKYYPGSVSRPGQGSFVSESIKTEHNDEPINLEVRRGDQLSADLALPPIDILKIDVEGFEPAVLRGFRNRIQQDRPAVLMEMSETSRIGFGSEEAFRGCFWQGAVFAGVAGAPGQGFRLMPFRFSGPDASGEILVVPPELSDFVLPRLDDSGRN